ncbi:bacillithiol system redox-active protein YtxJ [Autumnicola psychrophila]|uniref:Bacillithiol system redox-active protein YtxJ n=1 Tax=Autumnicola psychrophila TaxID=3075592 RepID=A0ABU3DST4_9FLAO|nr:bacillithiol system redox-active protein YtxJ [Zunongwangia sp. F225]MDT0686767.1 bacillithiol system redox-active protein YtxJ [Zunongwangia sp. F225]
MGIFDKVFKSERDIAKDELKKISWHQLTTIEQLEEIEKESADHAVAILKHSTRCGISRMVLKQFETDYKDEYENVKLYFLDLLNHRDVSNEIATRFAVHHESPQLIILRDGKVVHHASHQDIDAKTLANY